MKYDLEAYNLTADDLAKKLGYNPKSVQRLAVAGKLPGILRIRQWFFCEEEVLTFLKNATDKSETREEGLGERDVEAEASDLLR